MSIRDRLKTTGVWYFTDGMTVEAAGEFAARIETLGYSTLWLPDTVGRDPMAHIAYLATKAPTLTFATGIASIFHRHPGADEAGRADRSPSRPVAASCSASA